MNPLKACPLQIYPLWTHHRCVSVWCLTSSFVLSTTQPRRKQTAWLNISFSRHREHYFEIFIQTSLTASNLYLAFCFVSFVSYWGRWIPEGFSGGPRGWHLGYTFAIPTACVTHAYLFAWAHARQTLNSNPHLFLFSLPVRVGCAT